jgi:hypothetical protein
LKRWIGAKLSRDKVRKALPVPSSLHSSEPRQRHLSKGQQEGIRLPIPVLLRLRPPADHSSHSLKTPRILFFNYIYTATVLAAAHHLNVLK